MSYGYLSQMLDQLTSAYAREDIRNDRKGLPLETNIGRLFETLAWGLELVHGNAERMKEWDDLDQAEGEVLDRYGANFGVERGGATDTVYRLLIKVKMIALMSGGDIDTIIWAAASLFDVEPTDIEIQEKFPCKIRICVDEALLSSERLTSIEVIAELMKRIAAAGIEVHILLRNRRTYQYEVTISRGCAIETVVSGGPAPSGSSTYTVSRIKGKRVDKEVGNDAPI